MTDDDKGGRVDTTLEFTYLNLPEGMAIPKKSNDSDEEKRDDPTSTWESAARTEELTKWFGQWRERIVKGRDQRDENAPFVIKKDGRKIKILLHLDPAVTPLETLKDSFTEILGEALAQELIESDAIEARYDEHYKASVGSDAPRLGEARD